MPEYYEDISLHDLKKAKIINAAARTAAGVAPAAAMAAATTLSDGDMSGFKKAAYAIAGVVPVLSCAYHFIMQKAQLMRLRSKEESCHMPCIIAFGMSIAETIWTVYGYTEMFPKATDQGERNMVNSVTSGLIGIGGLSELLSVSGLYIYGSARRRNHRLQMERMADAAETGRGDIIQIADLYFNGGGHYEDSSERDADVLWPDMGIEQSDGITPRASVQLINIRDLGRMIKEEKSKKTGARKNAASESEMREERQDSGEWRPESSGESAAQPLNFNDLCRMVMGESSASSTAETSTAQSVKSSEKII